MSSTEHNQVSSGQILNKGLFLKGHVEKSLKNLIRDLLSFVKEEKELLSRK